MAQTDTEVIREIMAQFNQWQAKWIAAHGDANGFNEWFTRQIEDRTTGNGCTNPEIDLGGECYSPEECPSCVFYRPEMRQLSPCDPSSCGLCQQAKKEAREAVLDKQVIAAQYGIALEKLDMQSKLVALLEETLADKRLE